MKAIICGGRNFNGAVFLASVLDDRVPGGPLTHVITGGCRGADALAERWAKSRGIPTTTVEADWSRHGRAAGPIRNREMLRLKPDLVIAFEGGAGTADMVSAAQAAGIRVFSVGRDR